VGLYSLYRIHLHPVLSAHDDHRQPCRKCGVMGVHCDCGIVVKPATPNPSLSADTVNNVGCHFDVISSGHVSGLPKLSADIVCRQKDDRHRRPTMTDRVSRPLVAHNKSHKYSDMLRHRRRHHHHYLLSLHIFFENKLSDGYKTENEV